MWWAIVEWYLIVMGGLLVFAFALMLMLRLCGGRRSDDDVFPSVSAVRLARVKPGDTIVIEHPGHLLEAAEARLRESVRTVWPDNKCMVLEDGMTMQFIETTNCDSTEPEFVAAVVTQEDSP